jgi:hypothetical protein
MQIKRDIVILLGSSAGIHAFVEVYFIEDQKNVAKPS